ncbi:DNA polymerase beta superfamily protein [Priestia megaterium]|uniref:DNA polymerase beta superfamily protein n=1 Tax=Priestia megaterium TaxID=1404 RepID=UPI002877A248|nr:nucleotidyltransferase domain-containing protein [Priestia megaterium]
MKKVFKALVGSHNYGLNTETSDKDYKVFFYPDFNQLYSGEKYSKSTTSDTEDIEYHDIRKLPDMLWKSNVNFLEVLFSKEVSEVNELFEALISRSEKIAGMNKPYLYDACMGMFFKKQKEYKRDLENGSDMSKVRKHVVGGVRIVDFLQRYESNGWRFGEAIDYKDNEFMRSLLLKIKNGDVDDSRLEGLMDGSKILLDALKPVYKEQVADEETKKWMYNLVKWCVRCNVKAEMDLFFGENKGGI